MLKTTRCPQCELVCRKHSNRTRKVLHLTGFVDHEYAMYKCPLHGHFVPDSEFVSVGKRYSKALITYALSLLETHTFYKAQDILRAKCGDLFQCQQCMIGKVNEYR